jgi:peptidoglycan hydrolase-like protein with peptidoglycan-binding domain
VTTNSGLRARLNNLGYFAGLTEGIEDKEQLRWAIEEFQFDHGIKPQNGDFDDANNKTIIPTRKKLVEAHGDKEPV